MMAFINDLGNWTNSAWGAGFLTILYVICAGITLWTTGYTACKTWSYWKQQKLLSRLITVIVVSPNSQRIPLPYRVARNQFSRGELQGILGLYSGADRYEPAEFARLIESEKFKEVLNGTCDELEIPCSLKFYHAVEEQLKKRAVVGQPVAPSTKAAAGTTGHNITALPTDSAVK